MPCRLIHVLWGGSEIAMSRRLWICPPLNRFRTVIRSLKSTLCVFLAAKHSNRSTFTDLFNVVMTSLSSYISFGFSCRFPHKKMNLRKKLQVLKKLQKVRMRSEHLITDSIIIFIRISTHENYNIIHLVLFYFKMIRLLTQPSRSRYTLSVTHQTEFSLSEFFIF